MPSLRRALGLGLPFALLLAAACSSSDRPPAAGGSTVGPGGSSSGSPGSEAGTDAAAETGDAGDTCAGATQLGNTVQEIIIGPTAPSPLGGTIVPGTYVLGELDAYGIVPITDGGEGGGTEVASGVSGRGTLVVTDTTMEFFGARGPSASALPADAVTGFTYTATGTAIARTPVCPTAGAATSIPFSFVGGGLALFVDAQHRELYTKQ